jgi:hypothetical protein
MSQNYQDYKQQHTPERNRSRTTKRGFIQAVVLTTLAVLLTVLAVGLVSGIYMALLILLGGGFFAFFCFLSYYSRTSFSFNNIADTNQSSTLAFFTNTIPQPRHPSSSTEEQETLQPFKFESEDEKERQALEDMRVRAILRQVFPDED